MTKKSALDIANLTVVPEEVVPEATRYTPYREILGSIKKGYAVVLSSEDVNLESVRGGIRRLQRRGEFKNIVMRPTNEPNGIKKLYILNPSEKKKQ